MSVTVGGVFHANGVPTIGASIKLWRGNRFTTPPVYNSPLPGGAPDYGPTTSAADGAWSIASVADGFYWISAEHAGSIGWSGYNAQTAVASNCWPDGTLTAPGWPNCNDTTLGLWRPGAKSVAFANGLIPSSGTQVRPMGHIGGWDGGRPSHASAIKTCTGTVSVTSGNRTVTGSSTAFLTEVFGGDELEIGGTVYRRVDEVTTNTTLFLDETSPSTLNGVTCKVYRRGYFQAADMYGRPRIGVNAFGWPEFTSPATGDLIQVWRLHTGFNYSTSGLEVEFDENNFDADGVGGVDHGLIEVHWYPVSSSYPWGIHWDIASGNGDFIISVNHDGSGRTGRWGYVGFPSAASLKTTHNPAMLNYPYQLVPLIIVTVDNGASDRGRLYGYMNGGWKHVKFTD